MQRQDTNFARLGIDKERLTDNVWPGIYKAFREGLGFDPLSDDEEAYWDRYWKDVGI